jgi:hypothetical protein
MNTTSVSGFDALEVLRDQRVTVRDGIGLATDIYFPRDRSGALPVIIERTPYDKTSPSRSELSLDGHLLPREEMAARFAAAGFITVFQDCRGRYASEGEFVKYLSEGEDGFDTLVWLLEQPWCNGRIGSMGLSYAAHTQLAMACLNPPGLMTMVLDSGGFSNAYHCGIRQGGAFELKQATWAYKQALQSPAALADPAVLKALKGEDIRQWFTRMPWVRGQSPLRHVPEYEDYLFEQWGKGSFGPYWEQIGINAEHHYHNVPDIPILHMSSWYDAYVGSTLKNRTSLSESKRAPQHLIMGPWLHGDRNITHSGNVDFGPAAAFDGHVDTDWLTCRIRWFEQWLNPDDERRSDAAVQVFLMGGGTGQRGQDGRLQHGGHWLTGDTWPLQGSQEKVLYLRHNLSLTSQSPTDTYASMSYICDPEHPVPTIGGALTSGAPVFSGGAFDQRETPEFFASQGNNLALCARPDVLSFQTEPLEQDLVVAGPLSIELWVESDGLDTDFTAKLVDVYPASADYPHGYAMNITDGILRCRYRDDWSTPSLMTPGKRVNIRIEPFATCNRFAKGHRLRLDIASSNFPHFDVNPNSGEPEGQGLRKMKVLNSVHMSKHCPSRLILTVLEDPEQPR